MDVAFFHGHQPYHARERRTQVRVFQVFHDLVVIGFRFVEIGSRQRDRRGIRPGSEFVSGLAGGNDLLVQIREHCLVDTLFEPGQF